MIAQFVRFKQYVVFGGLAFALLFTASAPMMGGHDAAAKQRKNRHNVSRELKEGAEKGRKRHEGTEQNLDRILLTKGADVAIQDIVLTPHPDAGHRTVVVQITNIGLKTASNFTIGMVAKRQNGALRNEDFSAPLNLPAGASTQVQFRLGCDWINSGTITTRTNPSPVQGEWSLFGNVTQNNTRVESYGNTCS